MSVELGAMIGGRGGGVQVQSKVSPAIGRGSEKFCQDISELGAGVLSAGRGGPPIAARA